MAAALGNADAMYYLGNIFESGCQIAEDYAIQPDANAALRYYNEASEKVSGGQRAHL
jgi:TPR repeat protein